MKVKFAKTAGFCMGVRRAMEMVLAEANRGEGPLFTFGPLIHNNQVLDLLASKGVHTVEDLDGLQTGRIVIRAHGIPPQKRQALKDTGLKIVDATCPRVASVQAVIRYHTKKGYTGVIVGDKDHAEVIGLIGYSKGPAHVIQSVKEVFALPHLDRVFVVAQTTQNEKNYRDIVKALKERFPNVLVFDTICDATHQRQQEVRSFAGQVDALVVVGGYHSGNTQRLVEVSRSTGIPTFHVETEQDLDKERLLGMQVIGVTAGASTPNWMIKNVVKELEGIQGRRELSVFRWVKKSIKFMVLSNLVVASGAFSFAYATAILSERMPDFIFPFLTFLYIYAMHAFNRFLDKGASAYNDPELAAFLKKHKHLLITMGAVAITTALILSYSIGLITLLALGGLSVLGIMYSIPLVPERIWHKSSYSKIKDIPGSRTLSEALAWAAIITIVPLLEIDRIVWPAAIISILAVFFIGYIRSALFDIFRIQGDLIVGSETLPITLGEKKTLFLLKMLLLLCAIILCSAPILGLVGPFSFLLLIPLVTLSLCLVAYERSWLYPGIAFEALVEGNFFLSGLLAVIWQGL
ncbi:MAG: 4-hydroxy-3-methylbut-2-enyl diphosphate reductase [Desulfobacteraceae bacterium]|nr:MAG: 4-hydroxy-3-methylbut-2-enyl diphosphate reductase [Desulfobacteraceae bacterium]